MLVVLGTSATFACVVVGRMATGMTVLVDHGVIRSWCNTHTHTHTHYTHTHVHSACVSLSLSLSLCLAVHARTHTHPPTRRLTP